MNFIVADIDINLLWPRTESPEDAEFRRVFGREPDEADRKLGLTRVIETAVVLDATEVQP